MRRGAAPPPEHPGEAAASGMPTWAAAGEPALLLPEGLQSCATEPAPAAPRGPSTRKRVWWLDRSAGALLEREAGDGKSDQRLLGFCGWISTRNAAASEQLRSAPNRLYLKPSTAEPLPATPCPRDK